MERVTITATRWQHGWELAQSGEPITQVRTLANAERQVRDYFDTVHPETNHDNLQVDLVVDLGDELTDQIRESRDATVRVQREQVEAARELRRVAQELRARNVSVSDSAVILGVTKGRVSQLFK